MQNKIQLGGKEVAVVFGVFFVLLQFSLHLAVAWFFISSTYFVFKVKQEKILVRKRVYIKNNNKGDKHGYSRRRY